MKSPVEASNTVPRQVKYVDRKVTDKIWAGIYVLFYIGFIVTGFTITSQAKERYNVDENGVRTIGSAYLEDAQQCCDAHTDLDFPPFGFICEYLEGGNSRHLQDGNGSKFEGDEGIFDAFLMAPEIMIVMFLFVLGLSATWIILLRFFAKPIIILIEICKVGIFTLMGIYFENWMFYVFAGLSAAYALWSKNKLEFAARVISYSAIAMKENPSIFIGAFVTKLIYAGNAALFVYFFSESFDVVEVKSRVEDFEFSHPYCEFESPKYVNRLMIFNSIAYLWTILLLDSVRLSIVSTMVGSWHFHPEDKPGIGIAMRNVLPSIGTISLSSLIATVAERIKKWIMGDLLPSCSPMCLIASPFRVLACFCAGTLNAFVNTCTRFGLIIHVFAGNPYLQSTKSSFKILSRHFKDGIVTEVSTKSVLYVASYAFSLCVAIISWAWIADRFDCENFTDLDSSVFILYFFVIVFVVYYPVLGLYLLILLDRVLREYEKAIMFPDENGSIAESTNHFWIPPLAACFAGCLSMMMFLFITSLFLDISDTLFLCFCIDKDHNITDTDDELTALVGETDGYINADLILEPEDPEVGHKASVY